MRTKDDEKKEALFEATVKLVNEIGFASSSVSKIAGEAVAMGQTHGAASLGGRQTQPVNFIIHRGDTKDPGPDQSMIPADDASIWLQSGEMTVEEAAANIQATWPS